MSFKLSASLTPHCGKKKKNLVGDGCGLLRGCEFPHWCLEPSIFLTSIHYSHIPFVTHVNFHKQNSPKDAVSHLYIYLIPPQELPVLRSHVPAASAGTLPGTEGCPPSKIILS